MRKRPNWRLVRYADDFVLLTDRTDQHLTALREDIDQVLAPPGLRFSKAKTGIVHMKGFDFRQPVGPEKRSS